MCQLQWRVVWLVWDHQWKNLLAKGGPQISTSSFGQFSAAFCIYQQEEEDETAESWLHSLGLLGLTEPFSNKTAHNAKIIMMLTHWHWIFLHDSNIDPQAWNTVFVWFKWKSAPLLLYCTCLHEPRESFCTKSLDVGEILRWVLELSYTLQINDWGFSFVLIWKYRFVFVCFLQTIVTTTAFHRRNKYTWKMKHF